MNKDIKVVIGTVIIIIIWTFIGSYTKMNLILYYGFYGALMIAYIKLLLHFKKKPCKDR